jgi:hypothetical protein
MQSEMAKFISEKVKEATDTMAYRLHQSTWGKDAMTREQWDIFIQSPHRPSDSCEQCGRDYEE